MAVMEEETLMKTMIFELSWWFELELGSRGYVFTSACKVLRIAHDVFEY